MPSLLICDDEHALVEELAEWFCAQQWQVDTVMSIPAARTLMREHGYPDVLLIEDSLPTGNGGAFVSGLCSASRQCRPQVIALMGTEEIEPGCRIRPSADLWLPKPFSPGRARKLFIEAMQASPLGHSRQP
jgi:DNA-binding response OmpR family regulator